MGALQRLHRFLTTPHTHFDAKTIRRHRQKETCLGLVVQVCHRLRCPVLASECRNLLTCMSRPNQPSYPQPSYPQPSYPQPSYPQPSYPQPSYPLILPSRRPFLASWRHGHPSYLPCPCLNGPLVAPPRNPSVVDNLFYHVLMTPRYAPPRIQSVVANRSFCYARQSSPRF